MRTLRTFLLAMFCSLHYHGYVLRIVSRDKWNVAVIITIKYLEESSMQSAPDANKVISAKNKSSARTCIEGGDKMALNLPILKAEFDKVLKICFGRAFDSFLAMKKRCHGTGDWELRASFCEVQNLTCSSCRWTERNSWPLHRRGTAKSAQMRTNVFQNLRDSICRETDVTVTCDASGKCTSDCG